FHVMQAHHRIERDGVRLSGLAHHLAMHLTARGHVDDQISLDLCLAGEAMTGGQRAAAREILLSRTGRREGRGAGTYPVLGKVTFHDQHLAAPAQGPAAADRVDVDPEAARCLQERCAEWEAPALARGCEDDECVLGAHVELGARLRCPPSRRPRAAPSAGAATPPPACIGGASRKRRIQRAQSGSWPIMTSAPIHAFTISRCMGFMMAEVRPAPMAM